MLRQLAVAAALTPAVAFILSGGIAAQDAKAVIASAIQSHGRRRPELGHLLGIGGEWQFRAEQDDRRTAGRHHHHQLHARDRSDAAGIARDRHDDAADDSRRATAAGGNVQSEHHAGQRRVDAAARNLGHAVGLPQGRRGEQRHRPVPECRRQDLQRRVVDADAESAVRPVVPRHRLHRRAEHGRPRRDVGRTPDSRRPAGRHVVHQLPGFRWPEDPDEDRSEARWAARRSRPRSRAPPRIPPTSRS